MKGVSKSNHPPSDNLCNILTRERAKCRPNVIHHREERQTGATVLHEYSSSNSFANSRDRRIDFRLPIGNLGDASSAENSISSGGGALYVLASERRFMRRKCESCRRGGCRVASGNKGKSVAFPRGGEERGNERRGGGGGTSEKQRYEHRSISGRAILEEREGRRAIRIDASFRLNYYRVLPFLFSFFFSAFHSLASLGRCFARETLATIARSNRNPR